MLLHHVIAVTALSVPTESTAPTAAPVEEAARHAGQSAPRQAPAGGVLVPELRHDWVTLRVETVRPGLEMHLFGVVSDGIIDDFGIRRGKDHRRVCTAPCQVKLDPKLAYVFAGDGLARSRRFSLRGRGDDVVVQVMPRRRGLRVGGAIVTVAGSLTLLGGVTVLTLEALFGAPVGPGDEVLGPPDYRPGIAIFVSGAAILAGGITMLVYGRTRLKWVTRGLGVLRPLRFG